MLDKHPDRSQQCPRPVWGILDGLAAKDTPWAELSAMLDGAGDLRCLLRDTDSSDGDPQRAGAWIAAPLSGARAIASRRALLQLPPINLSPEQAACYGMHASKRYLLNVAEDSPAFTESEAHAVGRFSGSTAQLGDLEPRDAMLRAHDLRCAVLPAIYAGKAKVKKAFDLLARLHLLQRDAFAHARATPDRVVMHGPEAWGETGVFMMPALAGAPQLAPS